MAAAGTTVVLKNRWCTGVRIILTNCSRGDHQPCQRFGYFGKAFS